MIFLRKKNSPDLIVNVFNSKRIIGRSKIMQNNEIISHIKAFCTKKGIPTSNILGITIQKNNTTQFSTLWINFGKECVLENYPTVPEKRYKQFQTGSFLVCYDTDLPEKEIQSALSTDGDFEGPFCCSNIKQYRPIQTMQETEFKHFLAKRGNHPKLIFEVKRQINNGPLLSTKQFQILKDEYIQASNMSTNKRHTFKNYKCETHNLFFAVDLYSANEEVGRNFHHMRLNPYTSINQAILEEFFKAAGV